MTEIPEKTTARVEPFRLRLPPGLRDGSAWLITAVVVGFLTHVWFRAVTDTDLGWLIWLGDQVLSGHVPHTNGFSWTVPDFPWVSHETLVGVIYALAGADHVGLLRNIVICATVLLVLLSTGRTKNVYASFFAFIWVLTLIDYGRTERALSWGNAMLALTVALVTGEEGRRWRLPLAALLVGVWANMHGSFVIGIFVIAIVDWRWGLVAAAATLINPYGWHVWDLVFGYGLGSDVRALVYQAIEEWRAPNFTDPATLIRYGLLLAAAPLLLWKVDWRNGGWRPAILWLGVTLLAFQHRRFIDIAGIALGPWIAAALARWLPPRAAVAPWTALAVVLPLLALATPSIRVDRSIYPDDLPFSELAGKRLWNDFNLGGYLGAHGVKVFWDSRNDCYPVDLFADGLAVEKEKDGWRKVFAKWRIDTVVSRKPDLIAALVAEGWHKRGQWGDVSVLAQP
jgi:hypothetical protein